MNTQGESATTQRAGGFQAGWSQSVKHNWTDFLHVIWRQRWTCLWVTAAVFVILVGFILSLTPEYRATTLVALDQRSGDAINLQAAITGLPADAATIETEVQVIQSREIAWRTIVEHDLEANPEFNPALRAPDVVELAMAALLPSAVADEPGAREASPATSGSAGEPPAKKNPAREEPESSRLAAGQAAVEATRQSSDPQEAARQLSPPREAMDPEMSGSHSRKNEALLARFFAPREPSPSRDLGEIVKRARSKVIDSVAGNLSVAPKGRSRVIAISFTSENPALAAKIANTVADFYITSQLEAKLDAARRTNQWLNDRIAELGSEVTAAENAVEVYRKRSGLIQGGRETTLSQEQVSQLNTQYAIEKTRLAEAQARLRQAQRLLRSGRGMETAGEVLGSAVIRDLRREEVEVERRVAELETEYGERHPRLINARNEVRDVRNKIRDEIAKIVQNLRNEVAVARARAGSMEANVDEMKAEVADLNAADVQLRSLEREAAASRELLEQLLARAKETATQTDFQQPDATVISEASIPDNPSLAGKSTLGILALGFSLLVGVGSGFGIDSLSRGFRSTDELRRSFEARILGLLPELTRLAKLGKQPQDYVLDKPMSAYAESLRHLYTNILLSDPADKPKSVLFTSAGPNEGKTAVVTSLARLLANSGHRVLVIDCDLRRPSVAENFGKKVRPGLVEFLTGEIGLEAAIQHDERSGVHFICCGVKEEKLPTLLDSVEMQKLLKEAARNYDLVLLDSAPVLAVSDTLFVARLVDKTVFLVRWNATRRETAQLAFDRLQEARCDVAGVALSMVNVKRHAEYGYSDSGVYSGKMARYYSS